MKTLTLAELFTEQQLRQAAKIMKHPQYFTSPNSELKKMLEPDKARFDSLEVLIPYAAYVLEWKREEILAQYGP